MKYIREKKIYCGDYLEVDIIPRARTEIVQKGKRHKKKKLSAPKQKNLNEKNARRYFIQLANTNFDKNDLHVSTTYSDDELPKTIEDAEREIKNYLRRVDYRRKKEGLDPLKYLLVTEYQTEGIGETPIRIHHHIMMNGGLDRDVVESLWSRRKKKGVKNKKSIGFVNTDRLQPDEYGIEALSRYLMKNPKGKKRWSSSKNLERPESRNNDHKYTKRQVEKAAKNSEDRTYWEKQYPGYWLTEFTPVYNDLTGWSIYLKMRKNDRENKT